MVVSRHNWGGFECNEQKPSEQQNGRKRKAPKWQPWKDAGSKRSCKHHVNQKEERLSEPPVARTETNPFGFSFTISRRVNESTGMNSIAFENAKTELDFASERRDKMQDVENWVDEHIELRDQLPDNPFLGATESLTPSLRTLVRKDELRDDYPPFESFRLSSPVGDIVPEPLPRPVLKEKARRNKQPKKYRHLTPREDETGPTWDRGTSRLPEDVRFSMPVVWTSKEEEDFSQAEQEREAQRFFLGLAVTHPSCSRQNLAEVSPLMIERTMKYLHDIRVIRRARVRASARRQAADLRVSYKSPPKVDAEREAERFLLSLEKEGILP
ncbi:hypothetical protein MMC10_007781 [Thelotrema lepadinum]|nr:hypothetical protein [Thelotrema lepadinum]